MLAAGVAQVLVDGRRLPHELLLSVHLAVEDPERVLLQAGPAVLVELVDERREVLDERRAVAGPAHVVSYRVQVEREVRHAALAREPVRERDHLDVGRRRRRADHLDPEDAELAQPPVLRAVVTEVGVDVVRTEGRRQIVRVREVRANDARRRFGPQGQ